MKLDRTWLPGGLAAFAVLALLLGAGCAGDSKDTGTNPDPDPDPDPDSVFVSLTNSAVTVFPPGIEVTDTAALTLTVRDQRGNAVNRALTVAFTADGGTSQGQIGAITNHLDGTYSSTFTGTAVGTPTTIGATIEGAPVTSALPTLRVRAALSDTTAAIPLIDMDGFSYLGFPGLPYPESNDIPPVHAARRPSLNTNVPFVMLSIGYSNVKMEFCDPFASRDVATGGKIGPEECASHSFVGKVFGDPALNDNLAIVNGAQSGRAADEWDDPSDGTFSIVFNRLTGLGYNEDQVQVVWCKLANIRPTTSLPGGPGEANAFTLLRTLGKAVRAFKMRYPNLKQVYFSSRIYSYGSGGPSDEPFAYENAYSIKWLIEAQILQLEPGGAPDALAGDLGLDVAPWLAWGPYIWANGAEPRSDNLTWVVNDFRPDGTHPNENGRDKVAVILRDFFMTSPLTTPWFLD